MQCTCIVFFQFLLGKFYKVSKALPVYERNATVRSYGMKETCSLLVDRQIDDIKVCKTSPVNIEHDCTFVIDQSKLAHSDDIRADDCDVWRNNGERLCIVTWQNEDAAIVARGAKLCKQYQMKQNDYTVCRSYFVHRSYSDFRKVLSVIYGMLIINVLAISCMLITTYSGLCTLHKLHYIIRSLILGLSVYALSPK